MPWLTRALEETMSPEEQIRLIIDTIPTLAWSARTDGAAEFFNRRWLDYAGLSADQALEWGWTVALHPNDLSPLMSYWKSILDSGEPGEIEARLRRHDGEFRWFLFRVSPLCDESGRVVQWCGTNTDIEKLKEVEEKLRRSEAGLHEAQRLSLTGSFKLDVLSGAVTVSPEILRRYAVTPGDDTSHPDFWFSRIHPEDRQRVREYFETCLMRKSDYEADYRIVLPDETIKYEYAVGHPVVNESGVLVKFIGTSIDVTERHSLQRALQHERDRLRLLLDLNNRVASQLDLPQLFRTISTELRRVFKCDFVGLARPERSGKYLRQLMVDYPESNGFFAEGKLYPVDASCAGIALRNAKPFMINDVSEGRPFWSQDEAFSKGVATELVKSGCFLPMISSGRVLGVLQIMSLKEVCIHAGRSRIPAEGSSPDYHPIQERTSV